VEDWQPTSSLGEILVVVGCLSFASAGSMDYLARTHRPHTTLLGCYELLQTLYNST
jgi:hypothetical protein